jgi:hypothetical protein
MKSNVHNELNQTNQQVSRFYQSDSDPDLKSGNIEIVADGPVELTTQLRR